jgi:hypothetical protein
VNIGPLPGGGATTTILRKQRCIKAQLEHVSHRHVEGNALPDLEVLGVYDPTVCEDVKLYLGRRYRIVTQPDRSLKQGILAPQYVCPLPLIRAEAELCTQGLRIGNTIDLRNALRVIRLAISRRLEILDVGHERRTAGR